MSRSSKGSEIAAPAIDFVTEFTFLSACSFSKALTRTSKRRWRSYSDLDMNRWSNRQRVSRRMACLIAVKLPYPYSCVRQSKTISLSRLKYLDFWGKEIVISSIGRSYPMTFYLINLGASNLNEWIASAFLKFLLILSASARSSILSKKRSRYYST